jgi:hypothetical protein
MLDRILRYFSPELDAATQDVERVEDFCESIEAAL